MTEEILLTTEGRLPGLKPYKTGKVRDIYDLGDKLLMVATDRISAFDVVLPTGIPYKGKVLTYLTGFWFDYLASICQSHLISMDIRSFPELRPFSDLLEGRSMVVRKAIPLPVECVVRGYLAGSAWQEYQANGGVVCGVELPPGLQESEQIPGEPIFTPAAKALTGHDENITFPQMVDVLTEWGDGVGKEAFKRSFYGRAGSATLAKSVYSYSILLYKAAAAYAKEAGLILADTKLEFGLLPDRRILVLIDEAFTPDSSRYWPLALYKKGGPQSSFDKQYVRDYLEKIGWDKNPPAPVLPPDVVKNTSDKYLEALRRLTGKPFV